MSGYAYDDWDVPLATQVFAEAFRSFADDEPSGRWVFRGRLAWGDIP